MIIMHKWLKFILKTQYWIIIINFIAQIHYVNRLKEKKIIFSINTENSLIKFDYLLQNYKQIREKNPSLTWQRLF